MGELSRQSYPPRVIQGDDGIWVLASTEAEALEEALSEYGEGTTVSWAGWMVETGWDQDAYESQEEFERESGYTTWWSGVQAPASGEEREKIRRSWEIHCG